MKYNLLNDNLSVLQEGVTVVYGELSESDLQQTYISAASNNFHPYIVDPKATKDKTDRNLYKRSVVAYLYSLVN